MQTSLCHDINTTWRCWPEISRSHGLNDRGKARILSASCLCQFQPKLRMSIRIPEFPSVWTSKCQTLSLHFY